MSLPHAVLGFLRSDPMTGYDLKKRFDATVRHFWPADLAQIYRTLANLAEQGLVRIEPVPQEGKPDRKRHHITEAGAAELDEWLTRVLPHTDVREATLVQIFFADGVTDAEALAMLRGQRDQRAADLAELAELEGIPLPGESTRDRAAARERFFRSLTLDHAIAMTRAEVGWLDCAIERLEAARSERWKPRP
ncbi:MAG: PadR family transcriptional regulator [Deltaproteobacteria bacterium]|nr:PadR family transcriptional regulator [Deltaproteobacteria bacterium]MBW2413695.1 PadR family transcriptional regulator [Deltaproteobacteria bacterium]